MSGAPHWKCGLSDAQQVGFETEGTAIYDAMKHVTNEVSALLCWAYEQSFVRVKRELEYVMLVVTPYGVAILLFLLKGFNGGA